MSTATTRPSLLGLSRDELKNLLAGLGQPRYRGDQVFNWVWNRKILDPHLMSDIPALLRDELGKHVDAAGPVVEKRVEDRDGTAKFVMRLADGCSIEFVLIPRLDDDAPTGGAPARGKGRRADCTLCVSTQAGCRFGCVFCRSGKDGLKRNLAPGEITGQLFAAFGRLPPGSRIRSIVLMGIGEPLDNYEAVVKAVRVWLDARGAAAGVGGIVLSTVGIPGAIRRLSADLGGRISLALSLHSALAAKRRRIVRGSRGETPEEIVEAACAFNHPKRGRLTVEVAMAAGLNDSAEDAAALARLLRGKRCMVNLIPVNTVEPMRFGPPPDEKIELFQKILLRSGVMAFIRRRRGCSIRAACGQLAFENE
jgi:23S rRNA (adenine2503-C2)-methyltransferase